MKNMYGKDKRDGLSKEGSGRVGTFKLAASRRGWERMNAPRPVAAAHDPRPVPLFLHSS